MSASDSDPEDFHFGHELEAGLLARAREWTDLFPWLRLVRTLRVAGSPPLLLMVALTFAVWSAGFAWMDGVRINASSSDVAATPPIPFSVNVDSDSVGRFKGSVLAGNSFLGGRFVAIQNHLARLLPTGLLKRDERSLLDSALCIGWSLLLWLPSALVLVRQGALLSAGRPMVSLRRGYSIALRQTPMACLVATVPLICVVTIALSILLFGWLARLTGAIPGADHLWAVIVVLIAIPCGFLAFGANVAVPLAWSAAANERDCDALDSLSRGYEYLMRRPLHLACYGLIAVLILAVIATKLLVDGTGAHFSNGLLIFIIVMLLLNDAAQALIDRATKARLARSSD